MVNTCISTSEPSRSVFTDYAVFAITAVFFTGMPAFGETLGVAPIFWLGLTAAAVAPILLSFQSFSFQLRSIVLWLYAYLTIVATWSFRNPNLPAAINTLSAVLLFVIFTLMSYMLFASAHACRAARYAVLLSTLLMVGLNIFEFFTPGTFSTVTGRSAGFHLNPNTTGTALVLGMILGVHLIPNRIALLYQVAIGTGVVLTFSRAAILGWALAVVILQWGGIRGGKVKGMLSSWAVVVVVIGISFIVFDMTGLREHPSYADQLSPQLIERLNFYRSETTLEDTRVIVAQTAFERFLDNIWFGSGTGSAAFDTREGVVGAHNMYLSFGVQFGIIGVLILLILFLVLTSNPHIRQTTVPIVVILLVDAFFTHSMLFQWHFALLIALLSRMNQFPQASDA